MKRLLAIIFISMVFVFFATIIYVIYLENHEEELALKKCIEMYPKNIKQKGHHILYKVNEAYTCRMFVYTKHKDCAPDWVAVTKYIPTFLLKERER